MDAISIFMALQTPDGQADPYPLYASLHELGEVIQIGPEAAVAVGYDALSTVLRDAAFRHHNFAEVVAMLPEAADHPSFAQGQDWILNQNAPDHTRIRSLISRAFTSRRVAGLEPAITAMTDSLLDEMAQRGADGTPVEFMQDFAYMLPVTVICELIGIPEADREGFRPMARDIATVFDFSDFADLADADVAAVKLGEYFSGLAADRRQSPRDDLLSALVQIAESDDGRLSDDELMHNLTLLLVAGFETTTNLLGNGLQIILQDSAMADAVRDGAVPAAAFVEEVLRYDSPVQLGVNRLGCGTEIGGVVVAAGEHILPLIGAGNRDPRKFAEPDKFDPNRSGAGPLSFGGGAHFCIGAALARLEASVAFPRLLARFPQLAAAGEPARRKGMVLRGFDTLPVTVV